MTDSYKGLASIRPLDDPNGVDLSLEVSAEIDDLGSPGWAGTIDALPHVPRFVDGEVIVVLVDGGRAGERSRAMVAAPGPADLSLIGMEPFG